MQKLKTRGLICDVCRQKEAGYIANYRTIQHIKLCNNCKQTIEVQTNE